MATTKKEQRDSDVLEVLQREFLSEQIQQRRGQGGKMMDYVSHGLVTERLTEADPAWRSEVVGTHTWQDPQGSLHCLGITLALTLYFPESGAVTRVESGGPQQLGRFVDEIKAAQSDALKRAAMRFGVGLAMWEELIDSQADETTGVYQGPQPRAVVNNVPVGEGAVVRPIREDPNFLTGEQANAISRLRLEINEETWVDMIVSGASHKGSVDINELTRREASSVIKTLSKRAAEQRKAARA